jgi:hypothetical protein
MTRIFKAITLQEPYATKVAEGTKTLETRTWETSHRGDLVICCGVDPASKNSGLALCVVELHHIEDMKPEHEVAAAIRPYPKAKSWFFRNWRKLDPPVPLKALKGVKLGVYEVELPDHVQLIPQRTIIPYPVLP